MAFIQIIEFRTDRIDEVLGVMSEWEQASPDVPEGFRGTMCEDRDNPGTYLQVVEFPSYEAAMENSNRPETTTFAERIAKLCEGETTFRNLDVKRSFP